MASHRMPDQDRPRRAVPAWVVAPPEDAAPGREAHPTPAPPVAVDDVVAPEALVASAPHLEPSGSAPTAPTQADADPSVGSLPQGDVVVPDYPPQEHLLPPAPTSPAVQVPPFDTAPLPVSPVDAVMGGTIGTTASGRMHAHLTPPTDPAHPADRRTAPPAPPAHAAGPVRPVVPGVGEPRFSVPGLEHVLVAGVEPEASGPIGYRTPARFARQQAPRPTVVEPAAPTFDAVIAPPAATPGARPGAAAEAVTSRFPAVSVPAVSAPASSTAPGVAAPATTIAPATETATAETSATSATSAGRPSRLGNAARPGKASRRAGGGTGLQAGTRPTRDRSRTAIGATPAAVLGAISGTAALGAAAWWFTAPATVHAVALVLGLLALVLSATALRDPVATWQRPVALLGAVLGGVGTLVLLWAVASALLPLAGVTLPDLTGSGIVPTVAP